MRAVVGLLCYFAACAVGTFAVDVSSAVMPTAWKCLRANGYKEAIIRAYRSSGSVSVSSSCRVVRGAASLKSLLPGGSACTAHVLQRTGRRLFAQRCARGFVFFSLSLAHPLQDLGIYLFPCPRCGNPAAQVRAMMANMAA